jgi:Spy/CpxP family protein refolding chaperone
VVAQASEEYAAKIELLQRQIDALVKDRDDKAAAVLTPEQRKMVADLRAAAQKARDAKKAAQSEPDEE